MAKNQNEDPKEEVKIELKSIQTWADEKRTPSWQLAALLTSSGNRSDKKVSADEYSRLIKAAMNSSQS